MIESLLTFKNIMKRPYLMFFWTFLLSSVAIILSSRITIISPTINLSGLFAVIFTIIPSIYFITVMINREEELEEKELEKKYSLSIWKRHEKDIFILLAYFFGLVFSFAVWMVITPDTFQIQVNEIDKVLRGFSTGAATSPAFTFESILLNNLNVMAFSFILSLLFGAGAVFIIVWNASILGVRIGQMAGGALHNIPAETIPYLPHGILEIGGYVLAALCGGLISAAIIRGHHRRGVMKRVLLDAGLIMAVAIIMLIAGAAVEKFL